MFDSVSPLDYRYLNGEVGEELRHYFSEDGFVAYLCKVELALVKALADSGVCGQEVYDEVAKAIELVTAAEVYEEENKVKHQMRALVNCIGRNVGDKSKPFIHLGATSFDIIDAANAIRFKQAAERVLIPKLLSLETVLIGLALREKETLQIGRTHGQHAEPITFGFAIASYVSRLGGRIVAITKSSERLCGKMSGAVGTYGAFSLFLKDPIEFEAQVMRELGLEPAISSSQIVEAEPMVDFIHSLVSCFGVLANLSDDMRNLQRSEISEVGEEFLAKQVGSSTMPHKKNPINFENVKSLWKHFVPQMTSVYLDQISDHQRDLTNSASQRFYPEIFIGLYLAVDRIESTMKKLVVDRASLKANFDAAKGKIVAEPLYVLLALAGDVGAHELVRKATIAAQANNKDLIEAIESDNDLNALISKLPKDKLGLIRNPEKYIGKAVEKTEVICNYWKSNLKI